MLEPIKTTWRGSKMALTSTIQIRPSTDLGETKRKKHNPFTFINLTGTYFLSIIFMYAKAAPKVNMAEKAKTLRSELGKKGGESSRK